MTIALEVEVASDVKEFGRLLSVLADLVPAPVELVELIDRFPCRTAALDWHRLPAVRAGEQRYALKLSSAGLELLAADSPVSKGKP